MRGDGSSRTQQFFAEYPDLFAHFGHFDIEPNDARRKDLRAFSEFGWQPPLIHCGFHNFSSLHFGPVAVA